MILENATVRASAVSTLAKFGAMVDSLKVYSGFKFLSSCTSSLTLLFKPKDKSCFMLQPRIFVLLRRCLYDSDDEVSLCTSYLEFLAYDVMFSKILTCLFDFLSMG